MNSKISDKDKKDWENFLSKDDKLIDKDDYDNGNAIKTLYVQKMLERHILAKNAFYLSYSHKKEDVDFYLCNIKEVFFELHELIEKNEIEKNLLGPLAHTGFKRLA